MSRRGLGRALLSRATITLAGVSVLVFMGCAKTVPVARGADAGAVEIGPRGVRLTTSGQWLLGADIVPADAGFAIAWTELANDRVEFELRFARVGLAGEVVQARTSLLVGGIGQLATGPKLVALSTGDYLLLYRPRNADQAPIHAIRISARGDRDGEPVVVARPQESTDRTPGISSYAVASDGQTTWLLSADRVQGLRICALPPTLKNLGEPETVVPAADGWPTDSTHVTLAWLPAAQQLWAAWNRQVQLFQARFDISQLAVSGAIEPVFDGDGATRPVVLLADEDDHRLAGWIAGKHYYLQYWPAQGTGWGPEVALPANRVESPAMDVTYAGEEIVLAAESDATTAVARLVVGRFARRSGPIAIGPSSPACVDGLPCLLPHLATSADATALLFTATVNASHELYLTLLAR
jgi:hypothetical protein